MGENSAIAWCNHTFNPWIGCQKVSWGCDFCYAETLMDHRHHRVQWGPHGERVRTSLDYWREPMRWAKKAAAAGVRHRVFCASLADVFDNKVPRVWRDDLFDLIWKTPELDWLLLTKRPENMAGMLPFELGERRWPWPNVWLGTSCEDQETYWRRWRILSVIPAGVRFISYEPALGLIGLGAQIIYPDWIIYGGESGKGARDNGGDNGVGYARNMRDQCKAAGIAFFMKQTYKKGSIPDDLKIRQFPETPHGGYK